MSDLKLKHILKFKRGETYSVDVMIKMDDDFIFQNMVVPDNTTSGVVEQFLYDAEIAAIAFIFNQESIANEAH